VRSNLVLLIKRRLLINCHCLSKNVIFLIQYISYYS